MSHLLAAAAMYLPSLMTARDIAECISYSTNLRQRFWLHSRNIRRGQNGKVDTRSRNFALIVGRNIWTRWRNMSNLWASSTMSQQHTLHNPTVSQKESTALSSTWYVRCSTALVLHWNYGLRLSTRHVTLGTAYLLARWMANLHTKPGQV